MHGWKGGPSSCSTRKANLTSPYADARGVFRVYQMSLGDHVWKMWREAQGFFQRFTATFSDDDNTITGYWEGSRDGSN